jgi:hydrogenase maturation factor
MNHAHLLPGKLPPELLERVLSQIPQNDDRLLIGPRVGEDAAIIDMGDRLLVAKSDPITFATDAIGYYAVNVNANDIAAMGGTPRWFLATLLLPETLTTESMVETIFNQLRDACAALNITLAGGHTEITVDLHRPILSGHMLGEVSRERLVTSAGAQVGDTILLTKGFPVEGISIIARERAAQLRAQGMSQTDIDAWQSYLFSPGISVVRDAQVLQNAVDVHAMHDPTEGGVATGLHELAHASGVGMRIDAEQLPLLDVGAQLCARFGLDPLGTIASGALLAVVPTGQSETAIAACRAAGIDCYAIGTIVEASSGRQLHSPSGDRPLPRFTSDEMVKLFA